MRVTRPRFRVVLEALPGDVPADVRLRRLLKIALRSLKLKCVGIGQMKAGRRNA